MAHKKAALKSIRQTKKRTTKNTSVKKTILFLKKQALKAVEKKDGSKAAEWYTKLQKTVDKASKSNILKKNTASRKKSRVMAKINSLLKK